MQRRITGFHLDETHDWVAELDCFHNQHVRHNPPFINRSWVEFETDRNAKIGTLLECTRCDHLELPKELSCYKTTPEFDENTLPKGLRKTHASKVGAWGIIHVLEGSLIYTIESPVEKRFILTKFQQGIIAPCMPHSVEPKGKVVFYIEFYSRI